MSKVCVIGAGSSGIAACQVLDARGLDFDCFELGSEVGGNWRYRNDNGMSAAYRSLHINTSRNMMSYASYPMPETLPDYPSHWQIAQYFDDFVDHFGLRDRIRFRTKVTQVEPDGESWKVSWRGRDGGEGSEVYDAVLVANGHHWNARWPEPPYPGQDDFEGEQMHAHDYKDIDVLPGKRVLVLGIGNSACDIAVESSRIADKTYLAMRRGAHIVPKYIRGMPSDETAGAWFTFLPLGVQRALFQRTLKVSQGDMTAYGLPEPDHKLMHAHPTVSSDLLPRLGHGDIEVKPNIDSFSGGRTIRFVDGSEAEVDLAIYCTGYKVTFPFLAEDVIATQDNKVELYRRVVPPDRPGLFFLGLLQPLGAIMPLAEAQAEWIGDVLEGKVRLPSQETMKKVIKREDRRMAKRYVASKRHTIQVDFYPYLRTIKRERRVGRRRGLFGGLRARQSRELRLGLPG